jgi:hypothetical protein
MGWACSAGWTTGRIGAGPAMSLTIGRGMDWTAVAGFIFLLVSVITILEHHL